LSLEKDNKNIYDSEINEKELINKKKAYPLLANALDYIIQYSQIWERQRKINDMQDILKYSTASIEKINSCFHSRANSKNIEDYSDNTDTEKEIDVKILYNYKTLQNEAKKVLKGVDLFDFNIFDLNNVIAKKTLPFVSIQIFNNLNYFGQIVNENTFLEYIKIINDGYDRKMAYHNVRNIHL